MVTKTAHKLEREADVKGLGTIYQVVAPFDEALQALGTRKIIPARELCWKQ